MLTRLLQTFIDVLLAVLALVSWRTDALVVILEVDAGGSVLALIVFAVVDISLALPTTVSRLTEAGVAVDLVQTGSSILAFDALGSFCYPIYLSSHSLTWHSLISSAQNSPWKPATQVQELLPMPSTRVPPFLQSTPKQSSKLISQLAPWKPKGQEHWYPPTWIGSNDLTYPSLSFLTWSVQLPPFLHGLVEHSSMSI